MVLAPRPGCLLHAVGSPNPTPVSPHLDPLALFPSYPVTMHIPHRGQRLGVPWGSAEKGESWKDQRVLHTQGHSEAPRRSQATGCLGDSWSWVSGTGQRAHLTSAVVF